LWEASKMRMSYCSAIIVILACRTKTRTLS
jgi:hypothetical protein